MFYNRLDEETNTRRIDLNQYHKRSIHWLVGWLVGCLDCIDEQVP